MLHHQLRSFFAVGPAQLVENSKRGAVPEAVFGQLWYTTFDDGADMVRYWITADTAKTA